MSGSQQTPPLSTIFPINPATNPAPYSYLHHDSSHSAHRPSGHAPGDGQATCTDAADHHRAPVSEPLDLLALFTPRMAHPNDERDGGRHQGACGHDATCDSRHPHYRAIHAVGVRDLWEVFERTSLQRVAHHAADDPKRSAPGHRPPAG